ncbi:hypothetical protein PDIDSM_2804 [Penicillium digitatum]|nr:hypothetical protein PDIDSM_2804 [Penicillium digitatum]
MSTTSPRKSIDSLASGVSSPSVSFSTSQLESPRLAPQRFPLRKGSVASSIVSIGGVLESSYYHGSISESVAESGQNAISTLLQPPIIRTGMTTGSATSSASFKPPSSRDIPPVTLTNIKHVDAKAFQPYLSQVGSLYDVFQQSKEDTGEDALPAQAAKSPKPDFDPDSLMPWSSERRPSVMSIASRPSSPYDTRGRRPSSARGRAPAVTPLSTIPPVYFEEGFHLENPRTFDVISEKSDVVRPPRPPTINGLVAEPVQTGRKALATNAILQEKLSWYMDTVEIHLISSISTASKSFFTALGSLRELPRKPQIGQPDTNPKKKDLQKIDKEMALGASKLLI